MKNYLLATILLSLISFPNQSWAAKDWGLGVIIASPTGFSVKHRMSQKNSFDGALGYSLGNREYLHVHGTYLWEFDKGLHIDQVALGYYFGLGAALFSWDNRDDRPPWVDEDNDDELGLAVRGSAGINYYFNDPSFELFAELAMYFFFIPETDIDFGLAIGARYFF